MKIGIFETEHFEAAYPLVRLFDNGENEITIFCYPAAQRQLAFLLGDRSLRYNWITKQEDESRRSFIRTIKNEATEKKLDLLYLNTVSDNYINYALLARSLPSTRIVLTVHMIKSLFETSEKYKPRKLLHAIGKRVLRNTIKEFNVLSQVMVSELSQRLGNTKKIYNIPGGIYEGRQPHTTLQGPIHIVIPGSIDLRRRNYQHVITLATFLKKANIPFKITLLGRFYKEYGNMVRHMIKPFEGLIHYYGDDEIDQPEFDRVLQSADFLFSPSGWSFMDGVNEFYGQTITSGNIADAIRHAKPLIIPNTYTVDAALEQSCIRYAEVEDIGKFIISLLQNPGKYPQLIYATVQASKEYIIEKVRERNKELFR
jgi:hypothetical protein